MSTEAIPPLRDYHIRYSADGGADGFLPPQDVTQRGRTPDDAYARLMGRCHFLPGWTVRRISVEEV